MHRLLLPESRLVRTWESFRHPDQAAVAARLPIARRRLPNQPYWRTRSPKPRRMMRHGAHAAADTGVAAGHATVLLGRRATAEARARLRRGASSWLPLLGAFAAGLAVMYVIARARRRRTTSERQFSYNGATPRHMAPSPDNETLVARVRSEVLRDGRTKAGELHVDAYEGCVTLRGQIDGQAEIDRLVRVTREIDGVREVRSYLHLPGTLPPNKAQSYQSATNGAVPAHLAR